MKLENTHTQIAIAKDEIDQLLEEGKSISEIYRILSEQHKISVSLRQFSTKINEIFKHKLDGKKKDYQPDLQQENTKDMIMEETEILEKLQSIQEQLSKIETNPENQELADINQDYISRISREMEAISGHWSSSIRQLNDKTDELSGELKKIGRSYANDVTAEIDGFIQKLKEENNQSNLKLSSFNNSLNENLRTFSSGLDKMDYIVKACEKTVKRQKKIIFINSATMIISIIALWALAFFVLK